MTVDYIDFYLLGTLLAAHLAQVKWVALIGRIAMALKSIIAAATLGVGLLGSANGALLGANVQATYILDYSEFFPEIIYFGPQNFIVGPGIEIGPVNFGNITWTVDFNDTSISLTMNDSSCCTTRGAFNGWQFDFEPGTNLADVMVDSTNISGFDPARISVANSSIRVDLQNLDLSEMRTINVGINSVPVPATFALLGIGLLCLVAGPRRNS